MRLINRKAFAGGGGSYILDAYTGAVAAYSLRVLHSDFETSDLILCRRASDNAEEGFTVAEINDGTLETWAAGADAFVKTWYDQSGNGKNASNTTASQQPKLVSAGVLDPDGMYVDGNDKLYTGVAANTIKTIFALARSDIGASGNNGAYTTGFGGSPGNYISDTNISIFPGGENLGSKGSTEFALISHRMTNGDQRGKLNGSSVGTWSSAYTPNGNGLRLGQSYQEVSLLGHMKEFVIFSDFKSDADVELIEQDIEGAHNP